MAKIAKVEARFNEQWYLRAHRDVADAVRNGEQTSGLGHYLEHGKDEGRQSFSEFDAAWYAEAYPVAAEEVGSLDPASLEHHYLNTGRHRGYLPEPFGERRGEDSSASGFTGLWIDLPNAADIVDGKREIGLIDTAEQEMLKVFIRNGYVILRNCISPALVDRAATALDDAYGGGVPDLLFESDALSDSLMPWTDGLRDYPAKALDIHWFYSEIRDLIFAPPLVRFLNLIFERSALASQSLGFYRGSGQSLHQDSAYVTYSLASQFVASWIALEDVQPDSGELEYFVGSHHALPRFLYPGGVRSPLESDRLGYPEDLLHSEVDRHEQAIVTEGNRLGLDRQKFSAKKGDILIWHADLAHGGTPMSPEKTRKSVVTHYCPREIAPLYFEQGIVREIMKHERNFYTSSLYSGEN